MVDMRISHKISIFGVQEKKKSKLHEQSTKRLAQFR